jgi:Zn-dependent protease with chaperone function
MYANLHERRIRSLIEGFAVALNVKPPHVRFVEASSGPCYEALFNRIEIDERTLTLPDSVLRMVLAHEVAHATQRRSMLRDFAWTGMGATALLSIPCVAFATFSDDDLWRVSMPGLGFTFAWMAGWKLMRPHAARRAAAFELDADAKAAQLCGTACALHALLEMSKRVYIEPARIEAMRERHAHHVGDACPPQASSH